MSFYCTLSRVRLRATASLSFFRDTSLRSISSRPANSTKQSTPVPHPTRGGNLRGSRESERMNFLFLVFAIARGRLFEEYAPAAITITKITATPLHYVPSGKFIFKSHMTIKSLSLIGKTTVRKVKTGFYDCPTSRKSAGMV